LGLVQHVAAYERLTAEAAATRDSGLAHRALLAHPLIGEYETAGVLLERLAAAEASSEPVPVPGALR
jgi:6-phospho-beta-glucosidase